MSSAIRLFALLLALGVVSILGADISMSSLQSLPRVGVEVKGLPAAADAFALMEDDIGALVRRTLVGKGVPVADEAGFDAEVGDPILEVTLSLTKVRGPSHLYTIDLELRELVVPVRELESLVEIPAVTWKRQMAGIANSGSTVLDSLVVLVDDFCTEYRREN